jgi:hypothetical protein
VPCQHIFNLSVSGDRLLLSGRGVEIDVMPGAVAVQDAPGPLKLPDELSAFHRTISFVW